MESIINPKKIGNWGERIAQDYLKKKRYKILDKNYSFKIGGRLEKGEIDIVAKKDDIISFIEVKTLTSDKMILPEDKVDFFKKRKLKMAAESWLRQKGIPLNSKWQIDVISIKIDLESKKAKLRHFQNAVF